MGLRVLVLLGCVSLTGLAFQDYGATAQESSGAKRPLDLPSGGNGESTENEDIVETVRFWGGLYEAEAFFWLLDRSGSMLTGGAIQLLKTEMNDALRQLSARAEFAIVCFSSDLNVRGDYDVFPPSGRPIRGTKANKTAATNHINTMEAEGWTCMAPAAGHLCRIASSSKKKHRLIIFVGDGVPLCGSFSNNTKDEVMDEVGRNNSKRIRIDTIFIADPSDAQANTDGKAFFANIADIYGGKFSMVQR